MGNRGNIWNRTADAVDLKTEPSPKQSLIEILGKNRVLIENHCGVTNYGTEEICVKTKSNCISICGSQLELIQMTKDCLIINGTIECVRFCGGGK